MYRGDTKRKRNYSELLPQDEYITWDSEISKDTDKIIDLVDRRAINIFTFGRLIERKLRYLLKENNLNMSQYRTLFYIAKTKVEYRSDIVIAGDIAERAAMSKEDIHNDILLLNRKKYIEKVKHSSDTWTKLLFITQKGYEVLKKSEKLAKTIDYLMSGMPHIDDIKEFEQYIEKMHRETFSKERKLYLESVEKRQNIIDTQ